jgi:hypothetical protein
MPWKAEILAESVLRLEGPDSYSFQCPVEIIVRAVNSHEALLSVVQWLINEREAGTDKGLLPDGLLNAARRALAKAEGK